MADDIRKLTLTTAGNASFAGAADAIGAATTNDDDPFADTKTELVTRFELLPDDIKTAITDTGYQEKLFQIAKDQKLTYEDLGVIETETTMVLLGMTKPADYRAELQDQLKKGDVEVDAIVKAVNEQVFAPIRVSLEKVYSRPGPDAASFIPDDLMTMVKEEPADTSLASDMPAEPVSAVPLSAPSASSIARPAVQNFTAPASSFPSAMNAAAASAPSALTSLEKNVLGQAGVVITPTPVAVPSMPASQIPDRAKLLASIENPSHIAPNIVSSKLNAAGPVLSATRTTDYSMPAKQNPLGSSSTPPAQATAPATPAKPYVDPYREPL